MPPVLLTILDLEDVVDVHVNVAEKLLFHHFIASRLELFDVSILHLQLLKYNFGHRLAENVVEVLVLESDSGLIKLVLNVLDHTVADHF